MLFKESVLKVFDNSNMLTAKIIGLYNNNIAYVASIVLICRKTVRYVLTKKKYLFLITQTRSNVIRKNGFIL